MTRQQQNSIDAKIKIARCLLSQGNGQRLLAALERMTAGTKTAGTKTAGTKTAGNGNNSQNLKHTNYAS